YAFPGQGVGEVLEREGQAGPQHREDLLGRPHRGEEQVGDRKDERGGDDVDRRHRDGMTEPAPAPCAGHAARRPPTARAKGPETRTPPPTMMAAPPRAPAAPSL